MTVKLGLALRNFVGPSETPDAEQMIRTAEQAEDSGFESVWVWDHILLGVEPAFPILDSLTLLGAIAARTERIGLGTGVLVLPLRNPVIAAKVIATVDHISGGRMLLGVAAGWYKREFDAVGVRHDRRGRLLDRDLELLTRLWSGERVDYQDGELHLRSAVMLPRPVRRPRPPILVGGYVEAALRRVARFGDGWLTYFYLPEAYQRSMDRIRGFCEEAGRDPDELTGTNQLAILVSEEGETAAPRMREWLEAEWDLSSGSESTFDHAIVGTAEMCVDQLRAHIATGVDRLVLIPYRYEAEQIERVTNEVAPHLQAG